MAGVPKVSAEPPYGLSKDCAIWGATLAHDLLASGKAVVPHDEEAGIAGQLGDCHTEDSKRGCLAKGTSSLCACSPLLQSLNYRSSGFEKAQSWPCHKPGENADVTWSLHPYAPYSLQDEAQIPVRASPGPGLAPWAVRLLLSCPLLLGAADRKGSLLAPLSALLTPSRYLGSPRLHLTLPLTFRLRYQHLWGTSLTGPSLKPGPGASSSSFSALKAPVQNHLQYCVLGARHVPGLRLMPRKYLLNKSKQSS